MGSCLGHCRLARESFSLYKSYSKTNETADIEINDFTSTQSEEHILNLSSALLDENDVSEVHKFQEPLKFNFKRLKSIFSNIRKKETGNSVLRLELLDDEWSLSEGDYSARTESLVLHSSEKRKDKKRQLSASINSLDLEWEHLPGMTVYSTNTLDKEEPQSVTSAGGWSRLSSADSLEWDPAEVEIKEEIDTETEQLIQEIEMLSLKTLQETQEWVS